MRHGSPPNRTGLRRCGPRCGAARLAAPAALIAAGSVLAPSLACAADPPCDQLNASAIYVAADDSALPLVREAAWKLAREDDTKVVVYQTLPGCAAVRAASPTQICGADNCLRGTARFIPVGDLADWGPKDRVRALALTPKTCALPSTGVAAHVALSEVAAASCPASANVTPPGLIDVAGPVSPLVFVTVRVNQDPDQAIQAAEAYFAFGKGKDAGIKPWINDDYLVRRDPNSALAVLLGLRLNLQPARLRGVLPTAPKCMTPICATESDSVADTLTKAGAAGLAFLPSAEADRRRLDLRPLAIQALGQRGLFVTVQKEVADRLGAKPGTKEYGPLSIIATYAKSCGNPRCASVFCMVGK